MDSRCLVHIAALLLGVACALSCRAVSWCCCGNCSVADGSCRGSLGNRPSPLIMAGCVACRLNGRSLSLGNGRRRALAVLAFTAVHLAQVSRGLCRGLNAGLASLG